MKLIQAVVSPDRLESVKQRLSAVEVYRMTVSEAQGISLRPSGGPLAEEEYRPELRVKLEIAVNEEFVRPTIRALLEGGGEGGGRIFVLPLEDVIRIRTGERGREAI